MLQEGEIRSSEGPSSWRLLSVSEDLEGAMRLADYLPMLPEGAQRTDLDLLNAVAHLQDSLTEPFDLVIFAPGRLADKVARPAAQRLFELAAARAHGLQLVLAPDMTVPADLPPLSQVASGPPFAAVAPVGLPAPVAPVATEAPESARQVPRWQFWRRKEIAPAPARAAAESAPVAAAPPANTAPVQLIAVQGLGGGCGATSIACGFAAEVAQQNPSLQVLLLDLDLQAGHVSTYADLQDDPRVTDLYSHFHALDRESFQACLQNVSRNLTIFSGPPEILPADAISGHDMPRLLKLARETADVVILDLPGHITDWLDPVWRSVDLHLLVCVADVRCSHNLRRLRSLTEGRVPDPRRSEAWINRVSLRASPDNREGLEAFSQIFEGMPIRHVATAGPLLHELQTAGEAFRPELHKDPFTRAIRDHVQALSPRFLRRKGAPVAG